MQPLALEVQRCLSALQQIIAHALARPLICLLPLSALIQSIELILFCFGRYLLVVLFVVSVFYPPLSTKQEDKVFAAKSGILSYEFPVTCHSYLPHVSASQCRQVTPLACIRVYRYVCLLVCWCVYVRVHVMHVWAATFSHQCQTVCFKSIITKDKIEEKKVVKIMEKKHTNVTNNEAAKLKVQRKLPSWLPLSISHESQTRTTATAPRLVK